MVIRRLIGVTAVAAFAAGVGVLASSSVHAATPPPTPVTFQQLGMGSAACPLPINGTLAFKPGTELQLQPDPVLSLALSYEDLTIAPAPNSADPKSHATYSKITNTSTKVAFTRPATYAVTWTSTPLGGLLGGGTSFTQHGKLVINASVQKCQVAVQVPVPSVSVPIVGSSVTGPINGVLSSAVNGVNGALSPVNSAVGPILGGVNGTVGGLTGGLPGSKPVAGNPPSKPGVGTIYKPTGPTVAQRTVPQGYGSGSGVAGLFVPSNGSQTNAPSRNFVGTGKAATSTPVKSGGSPKTVDLAANKPSSALNGWSTLIVVIAVVALSGATAFYARTFLLHPVPATAKS